MRVWSLRLSPTLYFFFACDRFLPAESEEDTTRVLDPVKDKHMKACPPTYTLTHTTRQWRIPRPPAHSEEEIERGR